ncbi:hypothetical protein SUDANB171_02679 [Streptomyces sp. enrichment culture]
MAGSAFRRARRVTRQRQDAYGDSARPAQRSPARALPPQRLDLDHRGAGEETALDERVEKTPGLLSHVGLPAPDRPRCGRKESSRRSGRWALEAVRVCRWTHWYAVRIRVVRTTHCVCREMDTGGVRRSRTSCRRRCPGAQGLHVARIRHVTPGRPRAAGTPKSLTPGCEMERATRIELALGAWESPCHRANMGRSPAETAIVSGPCQSWCTPWTPAVHRPAGHASGTGRRSGVGGPTAYPAGLPLVKAYWTGQFLKSGCGRPLWRSWSRRRGCERSTGWRFQPCSEATRRT